MRAIIQTGGKQFAVAPDTKVRIPSLAGEPGDEVTFDRVLYTSGNTDAAGSNDAAGDEVRLGAPAVAGATVTAEIVRQGRSKKITVFTYKRRKRTRRKIGHRQGFTEVRITGVHLDGETEGAFACAECGKGYKTERGLAQHRAKTHGTEGE